MNLLVFVYIRICMYLLLVCEWWYLHNEVGVFAPLGTSGWHGWGGGGGEQSAPEASKGFD
jgi:hypothetical protein